MALKADQPIRWRRRIGILGLGIAILALINFLFDYVLYTYVIATYGFWTGYVIMTFLSGIVCAILIGLYDLTRRDWIGIETVKGLRDGDLKWSQRRFVRVAQKVLVWSLRRGDAVAFVVLSIKFDALVTTLYLRKGIGKFDGLKRRDWKIFLSSLLLSNLWWSGLVEGGLTLIEKALGY